MSRSPKQSAKQRARFLEAHVESLTSERDELAAKRAQSIRTTQSAMERADKSETEVARLLEALRTIERSSPEAVCGHWEEPGEVCVPHCARCILDSAAKRALDGAGGGG